MIEQDDCLEWPADPLNWAGDAEDWTDANVGSSQHVNELRI